MCFSGMGIGHCEKTSALLEDSESTDLATSFDSDSDIDSEEDKSVGEDESEDFETDGEVVSDCSNEGYDDL